MDTLYTNLNIQNYLIIHNLCISQNKKVLQKNIFLHFLAIDDLIFKIQVVISLCLINLPSEKWALSGAVNGLAVIFSKIQNKLCTAS